MKENSLSRYASVMTASLINSCLSSICTIPFDVRRSIPSPDPHSGSMSAGSDFHQAYHTRSLPERHKPHPWQKDSNPGSGRRGGEPPFSQPPLMRARRRRFRSRHETAHPAGYRHAQGFCQAFGHAPVPGRTSSSGQMRSMCPIPEGEGSASSWNHCHGGSRKADPRNGPPGHWPVSSFRRRCRQYPPVKSRDAFHRPPLLSGCVLRTGRFCQESMRARGSYLRNRRCGKMPGYGICAEPLSGWGGYIVILSRSIGDSMAIFRNAAVPAEEDETISGRYAHLHERDRKCSAGPDVGGNARKPHRSAQAVGSSHGDSGRWPPSAFRAASFTRTWSPGSVNAWFNSSGKEGTASGGSNESVMRKASAKREP